MHVNSSTDLEIMYLILKNELPIPIHFCVMLTPHDTRPMSTGYTAVSTIFYHTGKTQRRKRHGHQLPIVIALTAIGVVLGTGGQMNPNFEI